MTFVNYHSFFLHDICCCCLSPSTIKPQNDILEPYQYYQKVYAKDKKRYNHRTFIFSKDKILYKLR